MAKQTPYLPIQVGKALSSEDLGIQGDNVGDNISSKNVSYCELTGMYWAWKNLSGVDAIGLCHYRRYFDFHKQCRSFLPFDSFETNSFENLKLNLPEKILTHLNDGYVIVPQKNTLGITLGVQYCLIHNSADLQIMEEVIKDSCDKRYIDAFRYVIHGNNKIYPFNMFIMPWAIYDKYCRWLFMILEKIEQKIDIVNYNSYQKRVYGFMGERLLNIFLYAEQLKVKQYPIIYVNDSKLNIGSLENIGRNVLKNLNVFLYKILYY